MSQEMVNQPREDSDAHPLHSVPMLKNFTEASQMEPSSFGKSKRMIDH